MKEENRRGFIKQIIAMTGGVIFLPAFTSCMSRDPLHDIPFRKPEGWDPIAFNRRRGNAGAIPASYLDDINGPDGENKHLGKHLPYRPDIPASGVPEGYIAVMWGDPSKGYARHPNAPRNKSNNNEGHWYNWIRIRKATNVWAETAESRYSNWPSAGPGDSGAYAVYGKGKITADSGKNAIYLAALPPDVKPGDTVRIWAHCLTHGEYIDFMTL